MSSTTNPPIAPPTGWRAPIVLLMLMAAANALSFQVWMTLLNNFAVNEAAFSGREIGLLQSIREIPGLLAFTALAWLFVVREQTLAVVALMLLAIGTAATGFFPFPAGLYLTTLVMSTGFHYFATMLQSLSLQWLPKDKAAHGLGRIISAESIAALAAFGLVYLGYSALGLGYTTTYLIAGALTFAVVLAVVVAFPTYPQAVRQRRSIVLRRRYWLYYALTFFDGARRQIFVVFAGFMMVEKFGYSVTAVTTLFLVNHIFNSLVAPYAGKLVARFGERTALTIEYLGLFGVFVGYAFVSDPWIAAALYLIDHAFFAMSMASQTYFQKIADPADIAPTAAVAFSINHIAAVFLPATLGLVWLWSPTYVFLLGAAFAAGSVVLGRLIPRHPGPGHEVVGMAPALKPAE
jgi:predicted MFS family arabinose efflux permease